MLGLKRERVAEIGVPGRRVGSGYLVSDRHLLTAAHVAGPPSEGVERKVRCLGQQDWVSARVAWRDREGRLDLALLEVVEASWRPPRARPPRWGRIEGVEAVDCSAVGFPDLQVRSDRVREAKQFEGRIQPLTGSKSGQLVIDLEGARVRDPGPEKSPWAGMSGAAVFVGPLLVGVVVGDPQRFQHDQLTAVPLSRVKDDPELTQVLAAAGVDLRLEPLLEGVLRAAYQALPEIYTPATLLRPEHCLVGRQGREPELTAGTHWCLDAKGPLVDLIHGSWGMGKTRYAIELCREMEKQDWVTGFLSERSGPDALERIHALDQPALVIVDYAETHGELSEQLGRLAETFQGGEPIRLQLLAREAGDWWRQLRRASAEMERLLDRAQVHNLDPVADPEDRAASFQEAVTAFAEAQQMPRPKVKTPPLEDPQFTSILLLHMAALDAVGTPEEPGPGPAARGTLKVLESMLAREQRYWDRRAPESTDETLRRRMVTMATLIGAEDERAAAEMLKRVPDLSEAGAERRRRLARWLHAIYPGSPDYLGQLQPDALAEMLVSEVLLEAPELAEVGFRGLSPEGAERALTVLDRAAKTRPQLESRLAQVLESDLESLAPAVLAVAMQTGDPIGRLLAGVLEERAEIAESLAELTEQLPEQSVSLREVALVLTAAAVDRARVAGHPSEVASWLHNLSNRLAELGRPGPALEAIEEAVESYRQLAAARSEAFLPALASSLHNLSNRLAALGRRESALEAIEEAVEIRRRLAAASPEAFLPALAASLNNLSNHLAALGRPGPALEAIEAAVESYRRLAAASPEAFLPALAGSLNNLANCLAELGRREPALEAIEAAAEIDRRLAAARPEAFLPDLAMSLNNLSVQLAALGRREPALEAIEEAIEIRRQLAAASPEAFLPDLATSLNNLSVQLAALGRRESALEAVEEAAEIRRQLAAASPEAFLPDLAMSLNNLSVQLAELGRREPALEAIEEAITIYQALVHHSAHFGSELAASLELRDQLLP